MQRELLFDAHRMRLNGFDLFAAYSNCG